MDRLNNIVNDYKSSQKSVVINRENAIKELFLLRKRAIRLVNNANKTLHKRCEDLRKVNEAICEIQGHTYSDWEEHNGFLDRTWYYTRCCQICGIKERVEDEPLEYKEQVRKRMKIK